MPTYEYECSKCGHVTERIRYIRDRERPTKCEKCGARAKKIVSMHAARATYCPFDWSAENGGRGRDIPQLKDGTYNKDGTKAPNVYARSRQEAEEICKKRGLPYEVTKRY